MCHLGLGDDAVCSSANLVAPSNQALDEHLHLWIPEGMNVSWNGSCFLIEEDRWHNAMSVVRWTNRNSQNCAWIWQVCIIKLKSLFSSHEQQGAWWTCSLWTNVVFVYVVTISGYASSSLGSPLYVPMHLSDCELWFDHGLMLYYCCWAKNSKEKCTLFSTRHSSKSMSCPR